MTQAELLNQIGKLHSSYNTCLKGYNGLKWKKKKKLATCGKRKLAAERPLGQFWARFHFINVDLDACAHTHTHKHFTSVKSGVTEKWNMTLSVRSTARPLPSAPHRTMLIYGSKATLSLNQHQPKGQGKAESFKPLLPNRSGPGRSRRKGIWRLKGWGWMATSQAAAKPRNSFHCTLPGENAVGIQTNIKTPPCHWQTGTWPRLRPGHSWTRHPHPQFSICKLNHLLYRAGPRTVN